VRGGEHHFQLSRKIKKVFFWKVVFCFGGFFLMIIFINMNSEKYIKLISSLAIFLFIIGGNYVGDLYSCKLRKLFNDSMISKHIIGYFILLLFVGITQEELNVKQKMAFSGGLYIIFIIIMRAPYYISLFSGTAIIVMYLIDLYIADLRKIDDEPSVDFYKKINEHLFIVTLISSIVGIIIFIRQMKLKYKDKFHIYNFFLGSRDQECFSESESVPYKIQKRR
jgi:hypothetical protein